MNIVCVGAHQDDIELNCLGTLLKYQQKGSVTITNVTISNGDKGGQYDLSMSYEEVARMRIAEATKVAAKAVGTAQVVVVGATYLAPTPTAYQAFVPASAHGFCVRRLAYPVRAAPIHCSV